MRAADVEKFLVGVTRATASDIDQRTRWLRKYEHPGLRGFRAGRGRHAPHLNAWEAGFMLLCLAAKRATDAEGIARWLASHRLSLTSATRSTAELTRYIARITAKDPAELDFAYVLGVIIANAGDAKTFDIRSVGISETGAFAWIAFADAGRLLFTDAEFSADDIKNMPNPENQFCTAVDRQLIIGTTFLHKFSRNLGYVSGGMWFQTPIVEKAD